MKKLFFGLLLLGASIGADERIQEALSDIAKDDNYTFLVLHAKAIAGTPEAEPFIAVLQQRKQELIAQRDGFFRNNIGTLWLSVPVTLIAGCLLIIKIEEIPAAWFASKIEGGLLSYLFKLDNYKSPRSYVRANFLQFNQLFAKNGGNVATLHTPRFSGLYKDQIDSLKADMIRKFFIYPAFALLFGELYVVAKSFGDNALYNDIQGDKQLERIETLLKITTQLN